MSNYDTNRLRIQKLLKEFGIDNLSNKHVRFKEFILHPNNTIYLQLYLIICSGYMDYKEAVIRLRDLIAEMDFKKDGYTYRDIFNMDQEWVDYFKENAYPYPSGQRRSESDARRGVDKAYVDFIMSVKKGPPSLNLDDAIIKACEIKYPK